MAAPEQVFSTRSIEAWVFNTRQDPRCRLGQEKTKYAKREDKEKPVTLMRMRRMITEVRNTQGQEVRYFEMFCFATG
ncbi:hypothetical protein NQZ68_035326 [Dissostichus eleginoides]|nr:hypothetical protein NQZ68_035326 [Dissostichus eleginoides]